MDPKLKAFAISLLRRGTFRHKPRNEVFKAARVARGMYICAICKEIFHRKNVVVDHLEPVVDPEKGFQGFDIYIERMYCPAENFQVLCNNGPESCHGKKGAKEREIRNKTRMKLTVKKKRNKVKK